MKHYRRAFTLVELLVVIGIIGLLAGIILPSMSQARESARTISCKSQLRQIGVAIASYAATSQGLTPPWSGIHNYPVDPDANDPFGIGWIPLLYPYIAENPDNRIWTCPDFPNTNHPVTYFMEGHWEASQTPVTHSLKLSTVRYPSTCILCGEVTAAMWYSPPFGNNADPDDIDKDDATYECLLFASDPGGTNLHKLGNNILFIDGHVEAFPTFNPQQITFSPHNLQNWSQVTPE
jgi:prepilin-type N-terminal cleavage/methylation domain-containing protein/prepilin-type processing-associated H-X9-DG protein